ncbi:recombinase family protein [Bacillus solitudinis]|uniref:recombinase family protein n=1 Tax=Bacillus solitudinis TaxID=2014074 RepID=UPI000C2389A3|nr:recombinase family protein [Bacillus solitudinis]
MAIYGYARVSSADQNLDRQISSLNNAGCEIIFEEKVSGVTTERPELKKLLATVKKSDMVVVHSLDRISRSTIDLLNLVDELKMKGVSLKSQNDTWLDTTNDNPFSEFLLTVISGLSQYERKMIKQRQREGIEVAKKKGKYVGRVKKYSDKHSGMNHAIHLYKQGDMTVKQICDITQVSRSALYREAKKYINGEKTP